MSSAGLIAALAACVAAVPVLALLVNIRMRRDMNAYECVIALEAAPNAEDLLAQLNEVQAADGLPPMNPEAILVRWPGHKQTLEQLLAEI